MGGGETGQNWKVPSRLIIKRRLGDRDMQVLSHRSCGQVNYRELSSTGCCLATRRIVKRGEGGNSSVINVLSPTPEMIRWKKKMLKINTKFQFLILFYFKCNCWLADVSARSISFSALFSIFNWISFLFFFLNRKEKNFYFRLKLLVYIFIIILQLLFFFPPSLLFTWTPRKKGGG